MASQPGCRALQMSHRIFTSGLRSHTTRKITGLRRPHTIGDAQRRSLSMAPTRRFSVSTRDLMRPPEHAGTAPITHDGASPSSILKPESSSTTTTPTTTTTTTTPPGVEGKIAEKGSLSHKIASKMTDMMPSSTMATYKAYMLTETLYKECKSQAEHKEGDEMSEQAKFWYQDCGLPETFNTWVQVTTLYMWTIMVRLRCLERDHASIWQQHFVNHFFYDMEGIMVERYKINAASQRTKYLKEINEQFRGSIGAYDEGFMRGDAALATALWRNLWDASDEVDFEKLALVVSFVRRVIGALEKANDDTVLQARIMFGNPVEESGTLSKVTAK